MDADTIVISGTTLLTRVEWDAQPTQAAKHALIKAKLENASSAILGALVEQVTARGWDCHRIRGKHHGERRWLRNLWDGRCGS